MRNKIIIILIGFIVVLSIYFIFMKPKSIIISSEANITRKIENKETFILVIGESLCSSCQEYTNTTLKEYTKKYEDQDVILMYWDEAFNLNRDKFKDFLEKYNLDYENVSPTTFYIKNGVYVQDKLEDYHSLKDLESYIEKHQ